MRTSVTWRIFGSSAAVFVAAGLALALTPAQVSTPIEHDQVVVLAFGIALALGVQLVLLRRTLSPLSELRDDMRRVDVLQPGTRVRVPHASGEIEELALAFNDMAARLERERRSAAQATFAAIEDERLRIAGDLHDQIGQDLTALLMQLDRISADPDAAAARELTRDILDEVRAVVFALRPDPMDELGLSGALESMCARLGRGTDTRIECEIDEDVPPLRREAQLAVYRVAQEALTNALRHSGAGHVAVRLAAGGEPGLVARLSVVDDGHFTPPPGAEARPGSGLRGMRERAVSVGARITIGGDERGSAVHLAVPEEARA